jgi:transposase InsO family protein
MRRRRSTKVAQRNRELLQRIQALKAEHPFWGYRRIWAYLKFVDRLQVNKKRILRLMRENDLLVKPNRKLRAKRSPTRGKPKATRPNQWWGIDMTKVLVASFGWVYLVLILDWYTKKIVGYHLGLQCTSRHWLLALDMAVNQQFPEGARGQEVHLMSDNGCQPTSVAFMAACSRLGIHQVFTSYSNPRGNADTERMIRTLKEELLWLKEWTSPFELAEALEKWVRAYNAEYLHSALGYKSPIQCEQAFNPACPAGRHSHQTQFTNP